MPRPSDSRAALAESLARSIRRDRKAFSAELARREAGPGSEGGDADATGDTAATHAEHGARE